MGFLEYSVMHYPAFAGSSFGSAALSYISLYLTMVIQIKKVICCLRTARDFSSVGLSQLCSAVHLESCQQK